MADKAWHQNQEQGTRLGMQLLLSAYAIGGVWLFRLLLFPVISFYFLLKGDARRASRDYLQRWQQVSQTNRHQGWRGSFAHFWQFGLALLDKFSVWMGHIRVTDVCIHNEALIQRLIDEQTGAVLLLSHLGNFEICHALSQRHPELKLSILHHSKHTQKFNDTLARYAKSANAEFMFVQDIDVSTAIRLSEKTNNGGLLAIAADRVPIDNPAATKALNFLGAEAAFPTGPFMLAMALKVPIIALHCLKQNGQYHIYFEELPLPSNKHRSARQQRLQQLMQHYVNSLQAMCLKAPLQWFNFYPFWAPPKTK